MKRSVYSLCALLLLGPAEGAETPAPEGKTPAQYDEAAARLRSELGAAAEEVDAAVREGVQHGVLNISTEVYYLHLLEAFGADSPSDPVSMAAVPPHFDDSPEMERINLAWAKLRSAKLHFGNGRGQLAHEVEAAAQEAFTEAARSAENPGDLDRAYELFSLTGRMLPPAQPPRLTGPGAVDPARLYGAQVAIMREALRARAAGDTARLARALAQLTPATFRRGPDNFAPPVPEARTSEFAQRIVGGSTVAVKAAQIQLEKSLMARRPLPELDRALGAFLAASSAQRELQEAMIVSDRPFMMPNQRIERPALTSGQRAALAVYYEVLTRLTSPAEAATLPKQEPEAMELFALGSEFNAFLVALRREAAAQAPIPAAGHRGGVAPVPALPPLLDLPREIGAVQSWQEALACAERFRSWLDSSPPAPEREEASRETREAERSLRLLADAWKDDTLQAQTGDIGASGHISVEIAKLRERAVRERSARRLGAPELEQKPLADKPLPGALRELAVQASDRGDWRRAFRILSELQRFGSAEEAQGGAIRSFLVGQQMEQAELFAEARSAYQAVLLQVADNIPLAESAARLKALRAAHPEVFNGP